MNLKALLSNPLFVFVAVWFIIMATFSIRIATFFPDFNIRQYIYPTLSIISFSMGYLSLFLFKTKSIKKSYVNYFSKKRFNIFIFVLISISLMIISLNIFLYGLPPVFSFFGFDTVVYLEYGRFKGVLFAIAIFLFAISLFATKKLSFFIKFFSITVLLLYVSRGNIVFSILLYLFLLIFENKISNKRLSIYLIVVLVFILLMFQIIGELRTGTEVFYNVLDIKDEFRINNSGLIWLISYISMPFVNFLEITTYDNLYYGQNIISRSLPAFMQFNYDSIEFYKSILPNQYNTVAGYLAPIYLDFGLMGVMFFNSFIGFTTAYIIKFSNNNLVKAILMTAISLLFFVDYFFYFTTIVMLFLSFIFYKFTFRRVCA